MSERATLVRKEKNTKKETPLYKTVFLLGKGKKYFIVIVRKIFRLNRKI